MVNYLRKLVVLIWVPILVASLTVVIAEFVVIRDSLDMYESVTGIYVGRVIDDANIEEEASSSSIYADSQVSKELIYNIPALIEGNVLQNKVKDNLTEKGLNTDFVSVGFFKNNVSTEIVNNTRIIQIQVEHEDASIAQAVSAEIGLVTEEMFTDIVKSDYITVISEANLPVEHTGLSKNAMRVLAAVGGILIGFAIIFFIAAAEDNTY